MPYGFKRSKKKSPWKGLLRQEWILKRQNHLACVREMVKISINKGKIKAILDLEQDSFTIRKL